MIVRGDVTSLRAASPGSATTGSQEKRSVNDFFRWPRGFLVRYTLLFHEAFLAFRVRFNGTRKASMPSYTQRTSLASFQPVLASFAQAPGLPFQDVLTAAHIERVAEEEGVHFGT